MHNFRLIVSLLVLASLIGCENTSPSVQNAEKPKLLVRLASGMSPSTKLWEPAHLFKQELEKASPEEGIKRGEIKVDFYDQGTIGSEQQLLEATYFDVINVIQINTSVVTTVEPSYALLNLPYLFVNEKHLNNVLYGKIGQLLLDKLQEHHLQGLGFFSAGFRNMFYHARQCADTPKGLSGLKIRSMESPIMIKTINAIGPSATPIPFSELYQSIRTGVVDGAENSVNVFVTSRFYEAGINCFTFTQHTTDQHVLVANEKWLKSLPINYQKRIKEVVNKIIPKFNHLWQDATKNALDEIKKQGVRVNRIKNKKLFIEKVDRIAEHFLNNHSVFTRKIYGQIKEEQQKYLNK